MPPAETVTVCETLDQGWAINFPTGPHEKLGLGVMLPLEKINCPPLISIKCVVNLFKFSSLVRSFYFVLKATFQKPLNWEVIHFHDV